MKLAIAFGIVFMVAAEWMLISIINEEGKSSETVAEETDLEKGDWYYITCSFESGIAMRSEPSDKADLVVRLPYGTDFYVDTFNGTWGIYNSE